MQNYESPTIEVAGGLANHIEPQTVVPTAILAVFLLAALYVAAGAIAIAGVVYTPFVDYNSSATSNYNYDVNI